MKNLLILIIAFIGIGMNAFAVEKSNKELKGDKYFIVYSFDKAIDYYTHSKNLSVEGQRRLAESYHNIEQNIQSEVAYSKLTSSTEGVLPEDYYNHARILKINGKWAESNQMMDKFVELKPNDLRGKDYSANKGEFANFLKDDNKYKINTLKVNTDEEDFAPSFYKDQIVFASSRAKPKMIVRNNNWTGNPFYDLYVSDVKEGQLKKPVIFDKSLNGKMHDGPASFSKDGTFMAFTVNNYDVKRKDKVVELEIYFSKNINGKWSKAESFYLNNAEFSVGHPSLSSDGNTMYFISDVPGGFGGADIYRILKDGNGAWGNPENLGDKVNTEGDEMFPFFENNSSTLFFASNGRFGLGGLDVFICEIQGSGVGRVYNAGAPLNTQFDDFAVIVNDKMSKGYFSSNRSGGSGSEDIYAIDLLNTIEIKGIAKDKDENLTPSTFITLLDDKGNVLDTLTTKGDAAFSFLVSSDKNFTLNGKKEKYNEGNNTASTFSKDRIVTADVTLLKEEVAGNTPPRKIKKGDDLAKVLAFNPDVIYFDLGKSNIRPDAEIDLGKIIKVMNDNPSMVVELGSHTDCRASNGFNQILSDNRAKASADYIKKRITKPSRIYGRGFGETKLINGCPCEGDVSSCSEEEHQKNRRTEFIIVKE